MASRGFRISEDASEEIDDAIIWYYRRSVSAAENFTSELERALDAVAESPETWPVCLEDPEARRYVLRRFPFSLIYFLLEEDVVVVALAHHKRDLGYWLRR